MLFKVKGLTGDTGAILAILRAHDAGVTITCDPAAGRLGVQARLTSEQIVAALLGGGYHASRSSEPRQIHVSGGSDCCGSCS